MADIKDDKTKPQLQERTLSDNVLNKIKVFTQSGALTLPKDYVPANSLKFAWLMLSQAVDKEGKPVLQVCSKESVANALLEMCIQGLSPMKKQCYFIAYGGKLEMQRSYQGSVALAKRVSELVSVHANVIYEADVFEYSVDGLTGRKTVTKHEQKIENVDINKIRGAYAVSVFSDGTSNMEAMNMVQIRKAWQQGKGGGNTKAHINFPDEMAKKTVINRLCKGIINSSDDSALYNENDQPENNTTTVEATVVEEIAENANVTEIDFEAAPEATANAASQNQEEVKETPNGPSF